MLKPAEGIEGVKDAVLTAVKDAGPNACPPMVVGVGIGGTFEKCALMAKEALTREAGSHSGDTLCERSGGRAFLKRSTVLESDREVLAAQRQQWQ